MRIHYPEVEKCFQEIEGEEKELAYLLVGVNGPETDILKFIGPYVGEPGSVEISPKEVGISLRKLVDLELYPRFTIVGWAHSHPFTEDEFFSIIDMGTLREYSDHLRHAVGIVFTKPRKLSAYKLIYGEVTKVKIELEDLAEEYRSELELLKRW